MSSRVRPNIFGGGKGGSDKDKVRKPAPGVNPEKSHPSSVFGGTTEDLENTFPLLKRISGSRSIIPILVVISLLCGVAISSVLLGQSGQGLEIPASVNKPTTLLKQTVSPRDDIPPAPVVVATKAHKSHVVVSDASSSSGKADAVGSDAQNTPLQTNAVDTEESHRQASEVQSTDLNAQQQQQREGSSSHQQQDESAIPHPPPTSTELPESSSIAPEPVATTVPVTPVRGIHSVQYQTKDGESRDARAFPVAKGVHLLVETLAHVPHHRGPVIGRQLPDDRFVRSRFACLCIDSHVSPTNLEVISNALEQSSKEQTKSPQVGDAQPRVPVVLPNPSQFLTHGHHIAPLHNGHWLETRVMPCVGSMYFASTPLALCDPQMTSSDEEEEEAETPAPTSAPEPEVNTTIAGKRKKKSKPIRTPPKPAMVPIGPCATLDMQIAADIITKRVFNPGSSIAQNAFLSSFGVNITASIAKAMQSTQPRGIPDGLSSKWDFDYEFDAVEAETMCRQCGYKLESSSSRQQVEVNHKNPFEDGNRFRKIFFERERHPHLIEALREVVSTRWNVVKELLISNNDTSMSKPNSSSANITNIVETGLKAMDMLAGRCDKRHRSTHFAQCFSRTKRGNWSAAASHHHPVPSSQPMTLWNSSFFQSLNANFSIPSRLVLHPLNSGGHIVCYAAGDMVCDIVGRTGGWENELIHLVAYAATELRKMIRRAAAIVNNRLSNASKEPLTTTLDGTQSPVMREFDRKYNLKPNERRIFVDDFALSASTDSNNLLPLWYQKDDVTFVDIGGNVGVFAVSMWKRGYRTEVFEALPQNVFLLESSRCTNQADEFAIWEEQRDTRIRKGMKALEQELITKLRHDAVASNTTVNETELRAELHSYHQIFEEEAIRNLPPYYSSNFSVNHLIDKKFSGPLIPRFEIHHTALGNGKKGRRGDEALLFELDETAKRRVEDDAIVQKLLKMAAEETNSEEVSEDSECVMISEKHNFGDIVILCNDTLVADAKQALRVHGPKKARVLKEYLPRGFVALSRLDHAIDNVSFENVAMQQRFSAEFTALDYIGEGNSASNIESAVPAAHHNFHERGTVDNIQRTGMISEYNTTAELLNFIRYSQLVMKIDVEGNEEYVMQGATSLLRNSVLKPKLILSEVWRKTNIARYGALMIGMHGYIGLALADKLWLRTVHDVVHYQRTMPREMDSIVWIIPGFEHLIPTSAKDKRHAQVA